MYICMCLLVFSMSMCVCARASAVQNARDEVAVYIHMYSVKLVKLILRCAAMFFIISIGRCLSSQIQFDVRLPSPVLYPYMKNQRQSIGN